MSLVRRLRGAVSGGGSELERRVAALSPKGHKSWYYHLDFGEGVEVRTDLRDDPHMGDANWGFIASCLPNLRGLRTLDIGTNAGLYPLRMAEAGAREAVGLELETGQAEFVRERFAKLTGRDYSAVRYVAADARTYDLGALGGFDLVSLYCVAYHLADAIDHVMEQLAGMTPLVALQGNLPRLTGEKYLGRSHQDLAGVEGMSDLLQRHGFGEITVHAPEANPKPVVLGRRGAE